MIYILLICATLSFVSARPKNQQVHHFGPEAILKAYKYAVPCIEETNADPNVLKNLLDGTISDDEKSKNFVYCFCIKGEFTDEAGHFNIKRMLYMLGDHPLSKEFADTLTECNKITKETPLETAFEMASCLNNNAPVVFSL